MAASYFKLKMLRKKRNIKTQPEIGNISELVKYTAIPEYPNKCRICLNEGIIPIYSGEFTFNLPDAIRTIGGVEVNENDEFPKHLCKDCHSLLKGAVLFRNCAKESDEILRHKSSTSANTSILSDDDRGDTCEMPAPIPQEPIPKLYKCKMCKLNFKTLQAHSAHKATKKHQNIRIQCRICQKILTPQLYNKHLVRHQTASHLVCEFCGKLYRKDNLLRHLQLHSNELPFQCQICPYRGRFMESLKIHMRTHSGDKPFRCDKCELKFITRSNLNRHLLTHIKEKPFKCVECSRGFYTRRDLDIHLRADHIGIKDFDCRLCGNKYSTKKALMRHELRVHKRDKMAKGRMPLYLQPEFQNSDELSL